MADFTDFIPLFQRTEEDIRTQMNQDVNEGLTPADDEYIDTREGSMFHLATQPFVLEMARMWDAMTTQAAAGFLPFAWGDFLDFHGETYNVPRKEAVHATGEVTFTGVNGTLIPTGTEVAVEQADPDIETTSYHTTAQGLIAGGTITLPVEAEEAGTLGNVSAHAINTRISPITGDPAVDNAASILGGTDPETDEDYLDRILSSFTGQGPGNIGDYERWALEEPGVGRVSVIPVPAGAGTVWVVIMTPSGDPVSAGIVASLQARLDPTPGKGEHQAPISHEVTVKTPAQITVPVTASVTFKPGYSLDGTAGTIALRAPLQAAITTYLDNLDVGDDAIKNHVEAQFFTVDGVLNVNVTAPAADVVIDGAANPPQIATTGTITLT